VDANEEDRRMNEGKVSSYGNTNKSLAWRKQQEEVAMID
jgi:hypothetical protein